MFFIKKTNALRLYIVLLAIHCCELMFHCMIISELPLNQVSASTDNLDFFFSVPLKLNFQAEIQHFQIIRIKNRYATTEKCIAKIYRRNRLCHIGDNTEVLTEYINSNRSYISEMR